MFIEEVGDSVRITPPGRNSDQSFNGVGLPLLQINHSRTSEDGGYWWWHTPDDTRDNTFVGYFSVNVIKGQILKFATFRTNNHCRFGSYE